MKKLSLVTFFSLLADIITKQLVQKHLIEHQSLQLLPNFLSITFVKNKGVAFSILDGFMPLIIIITTIIIIFILKYISTIKRNNLENISYGLILGGALGNLIDRIFYGYVIDFIDIKIINYNYPIFNLADTLIVIGVVLILINNLKKGENKNGNYSR